MVTLVINNTSVTVEPGTTILQACEQLNIEVPVFCYHSRLSIAGNCRMCLVEVDHSSKPVASCAMPAIEGMIVHTNTPMVEKARKGNLEFLLINHPLDCPICDQAGECDLQDITLNYGSDKSRFDLNKRAVKEKHMGPLIKPIMTRCIHCTRCIRFADEIAGAPEIGTLGRGENLEITSYLQKAITSELSGNMIDICPVGALTSKPYAFHGRSWELTKTESIDVMDAVGSNIRIDSRGREVMRILPRLHEDINEEWISDRTRFACDGLKKQRLDSPYLRRNGKLEPCSWDEAFVAIRDKIQSVSPQEIAAIAGDLIDCEAMLALKELMESLGIPHLECRQDGSYLPTHSRCHYLFNTTIAGIESADLALIVASNPRVEAPLINARLRKRYLMGGFTVGLIGSQIDLNYPYYLLGDQARTLKEIHDGTHPFVKNLKAAKSPMMILGQAGLNRRDSINIIQLCQGIAEKYGLITNEWNGYNILHTAAARVGGLDIGFVPKTEGFNITNILSACRNGDINVVYLLGADEIPMNQLADTFVIYQGYHGDAGAHRADVVLPGAAYTEKNATYVNTEGRPQRAVLAVNPPGQAKEDWKIIRALSDVLGHPLAFDTIEQLRERLGKISSTFSHIDETIPAPWQHFEGKTSERLSAMPFKSSINNFYMTDPISRHSETMANCSAEAMAINHG